MEDYNENPSDVISRQCKELDAWRDKYRNLAAMYGEQVEGTSRLVAECNAWREKYRGLAKDKEALAERYNNVVDESAAMSAELTALRSECAAAMKKLEDAEKLYKEHSEQLQKAEVDLKITERSNYLMSEELRRVKDARESLAEQLNKARTEVLRLRSRNIFARILNR